MKEVKEKVEEGYRMPAPEDCPSEIYDTMRLCWEKDPKMRPSFHKLRENLQAELHKQGCATES